MRNGSSSKIPEDELKKQFEMIAHYQAGSDFDHVLYRRKKDKKYFIQVQGCGRPKTLKPISEPDAMADWIREVAPYEWEMTFKKALGIKRWPRL